MRNPKDYSKIVVHAPHMDDAALSLGGLLSGLAASGHHLKIVVYFGRSNQVFGQNVEEDSAVEEATKVRRTEEAIFAEQVSAELVILEFEDAILRGHEPDKSENGRKYPDVLMPEIDAQVVAGLAGEVKRVLGEEPKALHLFPLGIGNNVDHVLLRDSVEPYLDVVPIGFYEDLPYACSQAHPQEFKTKLGLVPLICEADLKGKCRGMQVYESQLRDTWVCSIVSYMLEIAEAESRCAERLWLPGKPQTSASRNGVPFFDYVLSQPDKDAVNRVLATGWLSMGPTVADFERRFAEYITTRHAIAVNSGTAALHLILQALGVGHGDEVLVPTMTFVATANAVKYCGGTPVFVDVTSDDDLCMSPADARRKISPKTVGIIVMHYGGHPCDMDALEAAAKENGLWLVEDACHAPGGTFGSRALGSFGHAAAFSFYANKNLGTGEGGMICTDDAELAQAVKLSRSHYMTRDSWAHASRPASPYDVIGLGFNYRMTELHAALGISRLNRLDAWNERRREIWRLYSELLQSEDGLRTPQFGSRGTAVCHLAPVVLPEGVEALRVIEAMSKLGISCSSHYSPVHSLSCYRDLVPDDCPLATEFAPRLLSLPLYPHMDEETIIRVADGLREILGTPLKV